MLIPIAAIACKPVFHKIVSIPARRLLKQGVPEEFFPGHRPDPALRGVEFLGPRILNGIGFVLIAATVVVVTPAEWLPFAAAYVLAGAIGILAFFVPSGLGVREAVIVLILSQYIATADAVVISLLARLLSTLGDGVIALIYLGLRANHPEGVPPMTGPHITIIGSALSGNKGASAMLEAAIQTLGERLDDPQFTLLSMYPEEDAAQNAYPNLEIVAGDTRGSSASRSTPSRSRIGCCRSCGGALRKRSRAIRALADSDVLLDQGGITFTDGREKFLLYNVASILPALNTGTPVFKCAQAIGPFENPIKNQQASEIFLPKVPDDRDAEAA